MSKTNKYENTTDAFINDLNNSKSKYSANSIMAWLCIDTPAYRKLREYVVKNLKYHYENSELTVRKIITSKEIGLKNNGIHNEIKEYLDTIPDYDTWYYLVWSINPSIDYEYDGISLYPLKPEIDDLFKLIKV